MLWINSHTCSMHYNRQYLKTHTTAYDIKLRPPKSLRVLNYNLTYYIKLHTYIYLQCSLPNCFLEDINHLPEGERKWLALNGGHQGWAL